MDYTNPDVYVQDIASGASPIQQASSTIGVMIGATRSGLVGEAQLIGSFTEYIQLYANGLETPFMENSDLTYAVHGFFTNGGKQLYIIRVASSTAKKALKTLTVNAGLDITAKYEGVAGNSISVEIKKNEDWVATTNELFDVIVSVGTSDNVIIPEVTIDNIVDTINKNVKAKEWIVASKNAEVWDELAEEKVTLEGGADGVSDLNDSDYSDALEAISTLDDATFVAIPGQTSSVLNSAILAYCDEHKLFPLLDMPVGSTVKETKEYRKSISANGGALLYPWGYMNDPLTNTLRLTPCAGHVMGVYSRIIASRGVHKAPAGTEADVKGFVSMEKTLTSSDVSVLNPVGVVCIQPRPNAGIVVWGARALTSDPTMRYVSDVLINYTIKKSLYNGTQFAIFEPNDENLWSRVKATCEALLESMRLDGSLKGEASEAYYVTVDSSNNTNSSIANGLLNVEIGYSPVKPAEFIVIKLAHVMQSA